MISYPDPEEFIQIAAVYGQELDSLHQRHIRVFSLLKDPVIEIKPAIIAVDKPGCLWNIFLSHQSSVTTGVLYLLQTSLNQTIGYQQIYLILFRPAFTQALKKQNDHDPGNIGSLPVITGSKHWTKDYWNREDGVGI